MKSRLKSFLHRSRKLVVVILVVTSIAAGLAFTDGKFEVTKNLDIFISLIKELDGYYVDDIDPVKIIKKGIDAMLESLDPYTVYIPESEAEDYRFMTSGNYGGIGALVSKKGEYVMISEPYEGFPAARAGLRAGDMILKVDNKSTRGLTVSDVSSLLKGQPETKVEVLIERPGKADPFTVTLVRENIHVKNVPYYGMVSDSIGYINLAHFRDNASTEVKKALLELKESGKMKALILDLRGNPGGLLYEAVKIVNLFVDRGSLIVKTKGKVEAQNRDYRALDNPVDDKIPLVVLVNGNSASASEIVSGALQDLDRAVIIGQKTFGKGLVQTTRKLSYNAQLKLTTSKYYIPSGRCIQALDYTYKDASGRAIKVPDSLISAFKTRRGRTVYDGAGITPDIKVGPKKYSEIINALMGQGIIFDYATEFRNKKDSIDKPVSFALTGRDYDDFVFYAENRKISYKTSTEKALEKLQEEATNENYFNILKSGYDTISNRIRNQKKQELMIYRDDINELLTEEIVSRYYFQTGKIITGLKTDPDILESLRLLGNLKEYFGILTGPVDSKK